MTNFEKLKKVFSAFTDMEIEEESTFQELDMDSLTVVEATMEMEKQYQVQFVLGEDIRTIADLLKQMPDEEGEKNDKN